MNELKIFKNEIVKAIKGNARGEAHEHHACEAEKMGSKIISLDPNMSKEVEERIQKVIL